MQPVQYNNLKLHAGAVFRFAFRLSRAGTFVDATDVVFTASDKPGGTEIFSFSYSESPTFFSVENDIYTLEIPSSQTASLTNPELYFQVDIVEAGENERWITGNIKVYQNAA
jgi:hypothetical protein